MVRFESETLLGMEQHSARIAMTLIPRTRTIAIQ